MDDDTVTEGSELVAEALKAARPSGAPFVVGVTGSVASGKSTLSTALARRMATWPDAPRVEVVSTDGFLFPNAVLDERGILNRKGYPETYDVEAMTAALAQARRGPARFPGYSHVIYDVDPDLARTVEGAGAIVVEGLGLHHDWRAEAEPPLDFLIYIDAAEADLEAWYVERFVGLWRSAEDDPSSFYARFRNMGEAEIRPFAAMVWEKINLPNLREHIATARDHADLVVRKGPGHAIQRLELRRAR